MIQKFVDRFMAKQSELEAVFSKKHPKDYGAIVKAVVEVIGDEVGYDNPDPNRVHEIDDGEYQGTLLFVIAADSYQPDKYWFVKVGYGSCSGCDTLQGIRDYDDDPPTPQQVKDYMTLALHVVQGLKELGGDRE
jgi:hypothetical protein